MDRLLAELSARGHLDGAAIEWVEAYRAEHGRSVDGALLELDLVGEGELCRALEACAGIPAANPVDVARLDPALALKLPQSFSRSFSMCPGWLEGDDLVVWVENPLPEDWVQELHDLFGLSVDQRVASTHLVSVARQRVYGGPPDAGMLRLEARLERRRNMPTVREVLVSIMRARSLASAMEPVIQFASCLLEWCCFVLSDSRTGRMLAIGAPGSPQAVELSCGKACALGPALRHGGYFLGELRASPDNRAFYAAFGREVPRSAFVAPVPTREPLAASFCADNGARAVQARWVAELTLLVARLGQRCEGWSSLLAESVAALTAPAEPLAAATERPPTLPAAPPAAPNDVGSHSPAEDEAERAQARVPGPPPVEAPAPPQPEPSSPQPVPAAPAPAHVPSGRSAAPGAQPSAGDTSTLGEPTALPPAPLRERDEVLIAVTPTLRAMSWEHELSPLERRAFERLKEAAAAEQVPLDAFVEELLRERAARARGEAGVLVSEVKGLFERLATDIPTHLARGMESAFRDLVPRLGPTAPAAAPSASGPMNAPSASPPVPTSPEPLVVKEAAPREVASYQSRRQKTQRTKL